MLAVLAFLSRSGLKPTVGALRCARRQYAASRTLRRHAATRSTITAINGIAIAGHQGAGTITDLTIRTLLTLPAEFVPHADREPDALPGLAEHPRSRADCEPHRSS